MPNKTIYVSQNDMPVFEQAQQLAGEALSSVIARALREYVARHLDRDRGMKEIGVKVGNRHALREQRFVGSYFGKWKGFSEDREWWLRADIYHTQKGNWAVLLERKAKTDLVKDPGNWVKNAAYLVDERFTELVVAGTVPEFADRLPKALVEYIAGLEQRDKNPVDYLDI